MRASTAVSEISSPDCPMTSPILPSLGPPKLRILSGGKDDLFDPNTWDLDYEHRVYGDDRAELWAIVDEDDYAWALQWSWSPKWSRGGRKVYLRRVSHEGGRINRIQRTVWLHIEVMRRTGIEPPSPEHTMVDHHNRDSLNCRRENLQWVTPSMNRQNSNPPCR